LHERSHPIDVTAGPPKVHPHIAAIGPTQVRKLLRERKEAKLPLGIVFVARHEHAHAPHPLGLLRPRDHRPRRRAPEPRDELPPSDHSITSSARSKIDCGTVRPSDLAVLRFTILNPHLSLRVSWDGQVVIDAKASNPTWTKWLPSWPTSPHWYDKSRFRRYMAAHIAHRGNITVREFISEFRGMSSTAKQEKLLFELGASHVSLRDLVAARPTVTTSRAFSPP
jgi:hypothetical protein